MKIEAAVARAKFAPLSLNSWNWKSRGMTKCASD